MMDICNMDNLHVVVNDHSIVENVITVADDTNVWLPVAGGCDDLSSLLLEPCYITDDFNCFTDQLLLDVVGIDTVFSADEDVSVGLNLDKEVADDEVALPTTTSTTQRDPDSNLFSCPQCPKTFQYGSRLKRHLTTHQSKQFPCRACDKYFSRRDVMEAHLRRVHEQQPSTTASSDSCSSSDSEALNRFTCSQCPAKLSSRHHYERHLRAHQNNSGSFECSQCAKSFTNKRKFLAHMSNHMVDKKFKCSTCGLGFLQREFLRRHELTHSREAPFQCVECGAAFRQQVNLKQHRLRKHEASADRPHACAECDKRFCTSSELKNHMLYHGDIVRAYPCQSCHLSFVEKRHLDRHIRRVHTGIQNFICNHCGKAFYEQYELNYHFRVSKTCFGQQQISAAAAAATTTISSPS